MVKATSAKERRVGRGRRLDIDRIMPWRRVGSKGPDNQARTEWIRNSDAARRRRPILLVTNRI
jgi:hypothetical protein